MQTTESNRSLSTIWILIGVFSLPWLAALLFYFYGDRLLPNMKTSNYGTLVQPVRPMPVLELRDLSQQRQHTDQLGGKWILVQLSAAACGENCQLNLYKLRQLRLALAEDRSRVLRLLVLQDDVGIETLPEKLQPFSGTLVAAGPSEVRRDLVQWLQGVEPAQEDEMYIVDPVGNLMMSYPADADPIKMLKDLKRLLKLSRTG